jgi:hypothetical protein
MADSYGHDGDSDLGQFDSLIDFDDANNYTTNTTTTTDSQYDLFNTSAFGLKDTFLAPELTLATAPSLGDYSATFCDGS